MKGKSIQYSTNTIISHPMIKTSSLLLCLVFLFPLSILAQSHVETSKTYNYKQSVTPQGVDNYLFSTYYYNARKAYNMKGFVIGAAPYPVLSLKYNPTGTTFALLSRKDQNSAVEIYDAWTPKRIIKELYVNNPSAICFSADSRRFYVANMTGTIYTYETHDYELKATHSLPDNVETRKIASSSNNYYLAAVSDNTVYIVNQENGETRTKLTINEPIADVEFSPASDHIAVLTIDGTLRVYDTRSFDMTNEFKGFGESKVLAFHPEGKYIGVLTNEGNVIFQNLIDPIDRPVLDNGYESAHNFIRFVQDGKHNIYLAYNTQNALRYHLLKGFTPNLSKMMTEMLSERMDEWTKMLPDETLEDYQLRVNDETRLAQARYFEDEIATELATGMDMNLDIKLGNYNSEEELLALEFEEMPPVYLNVPTDELSSFQDTKELEMSDIIYSMSKEEKFQIIYAKVYNKRTEKTYEFNNLERRSLDYLMADEDFVPIELVQLSSMDDVKLQAIKDDVVNTALNSDKISDHTHIKVNTSVTQDVDATGRRITNYKVNFKYTVDGKYSVKDDFAPGKYKIEESNAAISMLNIVCRAFEKDFAQYIKPGKKLLVKITGSADAMKIGGIIAYDGCYGEFVNEPYFLDGMLNPMTVTKQSSIQKNEQLAFMRAVGVKDYISKNIPSIHTMNSDYQYNIELAKETGSEYRRINVEFVFIDAFNNE